ETTSGKYSLENGFIVFSDSETHTAVDPAGVFVHPTATPSQYHIGLSDDSTLYYSDDPTSANYDNYIQTPFTEDGTTYSDTHSTVTISGSTITFNWDEVYKVSDVAVYEEIIKGTATCALTGDAYPAAYMVYYNENYDTNQIKTRYHVSGNTLTIYDKRTPMDFTKQ
ncbi:MAG: hypothetical protein IKS77_01215, partial [Spirochaetales bacterium]|nr:hypothetical protein [Spirochaetales bacterium]